MPSKRRSRPPEDESIPEFDINKYTINTLQDLIDMTLDYCKLPSNKCRRGGLKLHKLPLILEELFQLNELVGLDKLKNQLLYQILYYLEDNEKMLMHTVIEGPPGCGKTTVARIMGIIYSKIGILKKQKFRVLGRADLIGEYLGETTQKTIEALENCKNGVAFIDEAYSLGNPEKGDSYSKEAIDTINQYLLENKDDFICIIAGYKEELEHCFFSKNPGLRRRFPWVFTIEPYSPSNLVDIFYLKLDKWKTSVDREYLLGLFNKHKTVIQNNGGDIEILFQFGKIHSIRKNFGKEKNHTLDANDLDYAFSELSLSRQPKINLPPPQMYT